MSRNRIALALVVVLASLGTVFAASAAAAPCVPGTDVSVVPMNRPLAASYRPFYADIGTTKRSGYAGWELTEASSSVLGDDVWVRIGSFSDATALGLASGQSQDIPARGTSNAGKPLVYAYLTALRVVGTAQTFTVTIYNGKPTAGGTAVCSYTDGFSEVYDPTSASANKVSNVSVSTASPVVGGAFDVTAVGDTGSMGSGGPDTSGGNGVISMAPAMDDAWPADAFTLTGVRLTIGGTTYRDRLRAYPSSQGAYTAVYSFTVRQAKGTATAVRPVQNITSGNQIKYTGAYDANAQVAINPTTVSTSFAKGSAGVTSLGTTTQCSLSSTWYEVQYQVTVSNSSTTAAVIDLFRDTPTTSGTWCLKANSTQLAVGNGTPSTIADPTLQSGVLVFQGPYTVPAATSSPGTITATYRIYTNATTSNDIAGSVGGESITSPTAGANQVSVNPALPTITTASLPSGATGSAYAQTLTASGGAGAPYTWTLDSGTLPTGITLSSGGVLSSSGNLAAGAAGTYSFTVKVADSGSGYSTKTYSLLIVATDSTPPTATVAALTASPANASPIEFTATFSEPVTAPNVSAFTVGGTSSTWTVASVAPATGLNTVYTITLTAGSPTSGTVTLAVNANAAQDAAGNNGPTSPSASASITLDTAPPTVTSFTTATSSPTSSTGFDYTLVLSEAATGLTTGSFAAFQGTSSGWTVSAVSGSGTTWTVTVAGSSPTDGTVIPRLSAAAVTDAAGNTGPASAADGQSVTYAAPAAPSATVPGAPRSPGAAAGTQRITVSWLPPASNGGSAITGYSVTAAPGGATCTTTELRCTIVDLTAGTQYTFTIVATNAVGNGVPATTPVPVSPMGGSPTKAADNAPQPKVTICHREGGPNYVAITIAPEAVVEGHSRNHPKDIIPAFDYVKSGKQLAYEGQNLTEENVALLAAGCKDRSEPARPAGKAQSKVTLCHSGSGKNWVEITVAWEAVVKAGHGDHGYDIIPPFVYDDAGASRSYAGSNWNAETQAILENGCSAPGPTRERPFRSTDGSEFSGAGSQKSKVTLCHREGGPKWVQITIAWEAVVKAGHDRNHPKDIIPPFAYVSDGQTIQFPGQNWTAEGIAVFANECDAPDGVTLDGVTDPTKGGSGGVGGAGTTGGTGGDGGSPAFGAKEQSKVTLCHREGGPKWVSITIAWEAAISGHDKNHPKDIIPPFTYLKDGQTTSYPGQNWDATGIDIYGNDCVVPATDPKGPTDPKTPDPDPPTEITICHATGSGTYATTTLYWELALSEHHSAHTSDIIPAFEYISNGAVIAYPGQNWNAAGQRIFDNGCVDKPANDPNPPTLTGKAITPAVNCVGVNDDGTFNAIFSYRNDNTVATAIAAGADNLVTLDAAAAGATVPTVPTLFDPGSTAIALTITAIPADGAVTWSVTYGGTTTSATASLEGSTRCPAATTEDGVDVGIYATCVTAGADGGFSATFGYQSNELAAVSIPVGASNTVSRTGAATGDYGQPSSFAPGSTTSAFTVTGVPAGGSATWTIVVGAETRTATATGATPACESPATPKKTTPATPIGLYVSCVSANANGTYNAVFGYTNGNRGTIVIPAGPANAVTLDPTSTSDVSRGQPTSFMPGTDASALVVLDIPATSTITWTLSYQGTTSATAGIASDSKCAPKKGTTPSPDNPPLTPKPVPPPTAASYELGVFVSCVSVRGNRYSATFGYENPGQTAFAVAAGPGNTVTGASTGAGARPSTFMPGTNASAFVLSNLRLSARPTWTVKLPSGETTTVTATPSLDSCVSSRRSTAPTIETTITPPRRSTRVGTRDLTRVTTRNHGRITLYGVRVVIPRFPNRSTPVKITPQKGLTCKPVGASTVCTIAKLLPGQSIAVGLTTIPGVSGTVTGSVQATGYSATNQRADAVDAGPLRAHGAIRAPVVTG